MKNNTMNQDLHELPAGPLFTQAGMSGQDHSPCRRGKIRWVEKADIMYDIYWE
ncbi:MAG TPA: hypothetical protein PLV56_01690 [Synergistales bacterium]|nr:hypothetical protein [Synergistales bacterium]